MKSTFSWALLLFIVFNSFLNAEDRANCIAPDTLRERLFDYAGTEESPKYLSHSANVVLLGSSLLLHAEWCVDRTILLNEPWGQKTIGSESNYHLAQGLENELIKDGFSGAHVYNLAAGGALISDAYLFFVHYLQRYPQPSFVVLDCAPRSFNDSGVNEPNGTPVFDCCFQIQDFKELHGIYLKSRDAKINYILSKVLFLYRHRKWLSESAQNSLRQLLSNASTQMVQSSSLKKSEGAIEKPAGQGETEKTAVKNREQLQLIQKSLQEYRNRYKFMNRNALKQQLKFLERIEDLCVSKGIKLIIINMPLVPDNRGLLTEGFYDDYRADVAKTVRAPNVFIDLASTGDWPISCYHDSVHLNEIGGARVNKIIADAIINGALHRSSKSSAN